MVSYMVYCTELTFRRTLKTFFFNQYECVQRITGATCMCYINPHFTYLLTYLLSWTLIGYICHAETTTEKCQHEILYCEKCLCNLWHHRCRSRIK